MSPCQFPLVESENRDYGRWLEVGVMVVFVTKTGFEKRKGAEGSEG